MDVAAYALAAVAEKAGEAKQAAEDAAEKAKDAAQ